MKEYRRLVQELIKLKSISTDVAFKGEITKTAQWIKELFESSGFTAQLIEGYGNPIVLAKYNVSDGAKTCLVYGHYDVQPASKDDGWSSDPFTVTEKSGKLVARGIVDNKGQFMIHAVSIIELIKSGKLKYNIIFMVEGDEETGSDLMPKFMKDHQDELKSDLVMISDGEMPYKPVVSASFRGNVSLTMKVTTANNNLHSGLYGGAVPNAALEMSKLIAGLYDEDYNIQIPKLNASEVQIDEEEERQCNEMNDNKTKLFGELGIKRFFDDNKGGFCGKVGFSTMIGVSGMKSGYVGEGYSNIVPSFAEAKINFRISSNQNPKELIDGFKKFMNSIAPAYVTVEFMNEAGITDPVKVDISSEDYKQTMKLLAEVYGDEVLVDYCGATLPIVTEIKRMTGVDPLLVSLGNDDCNMHGVDENLSIDLLEKGLKFSGRFFGK